MARRIPQWLLSDKAHARRSEGEAGQVLALFVLLIPVFVGMAALAIDLGTFSAERRSLQNSADAIALAAAQELPDEGDAQAKALEWAATYGFESADVEIVTAPVSATNPNPSVKVTISQTHEFSFMKALGINDAPVEASAKAVKTSPGVVQGQVVPWAVTESTRDSAAAGDTVVLKYDSRRATGGNFQAIRIDGNGASTYRDSLTNGSSSFVCASGAAECAETSPVCEGAVCPTEAGNLVGATRTGVDYRIDNTDAHCDTIEEAFTSLPDGTHALNPDCNPWLAGSYASLRVVILPVIDSLCNGTCNVTVTGFSLFWLQGYGDKCTGSNCEVKGTFIDAELTMGALIGQFDPNGSLHYARLVE